jgi:hypothetical protein
MTRKIMTNIKDDCENNSSDKYENNLIYLYIYLRVCATAEKQIIK